MSQALKDVEGLHNIPAFIDRITEEEYQYTTDKLEVMQINVGRLCNLACKHCHVEAGPARTEIMNRKVMEACLTVCKEQQVGTIDITGGAPEMNPDFEWLVEESCKICSHVIVRTNLVILQEEKYRHLPEFYADHKVNVVCSLPYYRAKEMDRVRGDGTFDKAIEVIRELNSLGYGKEEDLVLDMVYNPAGAFFPPSQDAMEKEYKKKLENYEYPSVSYELADEIQKRTGADVRVTVPGHMQRGGSPNPYDRVLSTRLGSKAAELIIAGKYGYMVGIINGETCKVPLGDVAGKLKMVDPNAGIIKEAKRIGISFGD